MASGVKITGLNQTIKRLDHLLGEEQQKKIVAGVTEVLLYISAASAAEVPVDTSALLNSQFRDIRATRGVVTGTVGYSVYYAKWVHDAPGTYLHKAKLRPDKKSFIWDPNGNPKFLYWPFKDAQDNGEIYTILRKYITYGGGNP